MLLFSDFDGTLRDPNDPRVLDSNLSALENWRAAGNYACLITGRNYSAFSRILPEWKNYFCYLVTDNGGAIFDQGGELIATCAFPENLIQEVLISLPHDVLPVYYYPDHFTVTPRPKSSPIKLRLWFHELDDLWSKQRYFESGIFHLKSLPWPKPGFSTLPGVDLSQYCGFLDLVPENSGKEIAAKRITAILSVPREEIISIGDDYNDIALLNSFTGYAIDFSPSEVIQAASGRTIANVSTLIAHILAQP